MIDNGEEVDTKPIIPVPKEKAIFPCQLCERTFPRNLDLNNHVAVNHTHEYRFYCQFCNKGFYMESKKRMHEKGVHLKLRPYKYKKKEKKDIFTCSYCGSKFNCNVFLQEHIVHKHTKKYKYFCDQCDKGFFIKSKRDAHVRKVKHVKSVTDHKSANGETNGDSGSVSCPVDGCRKVISSKYNLNTHMKTHQNEKYICEICSKIFTNTISLSRHLKGHTEGPLSFVCDVCGKSLSTSTILSCHKRIHTGERPAQCEHCGKSFVCVRDLNIHRGRFHQGLQVRFKCKICEKKFQIYGKLKQHYIKYHPDDDIPDEITDI